jgi:hypothetical protein
MSSAAIVGVFLAGVATCDCTPREQMSWQDIKICAQSWKPRLAPAHRSGRTARTAEPYRPKNTSNLLVDAPHRPIPYRDTEQAKQEELQNKTREDAINRLVKSGICRGC